MIGINETGQQKVNTPFELLFLLSSTLKTMVGKKPIGLHYFFGNFEFRYRLIQVKSKVMRSRSCYTQNKKNEKLKQLANLMKTTCLFVQIVLLMNQIIES